MKIISLILILLASLLAGCVTVPEVPAVDQVVPEAVVEGGVEREQKAGGYLLPERSSRIDFPENLGREENGFSIWRSFGATLCILGALVGLNLYIRKGKFPRMGKSDKRIKFVEKHALDQKKSLMLFEVDGRTVLVGVGAEGISRIMEVDDAGHDFEEELGEQIVDTGSAEGEGK